MENKKYTNHPSVAVDRFGNLSLKVFDMFFCEITLPKFTESQLAEEALMRKDVEFLADTQANNASLPANELSNNSTVRKIYDRLTGKLIDISSNDNNNQNYVKSIKAEEQKTPSFFKRILDRVLSRKEDPDKQMEALKTDLVLLGPGFEEKLKQLDVFIGNAKAASQLSVADELTSYKYALAAEQVLFENGFKKYVTEEMILRFFAKAKRGVKLDFVRNYPVLFPTEVTLKKLEADKLLVFDNYVILYYNDRVLPFRESSEDKAAIGRKDPILFGMIKGMRKLYYIADWITKDDDLTLSTFEETISSAADRIEAINNIVDIDMLAMREFIDSQR